MLSRYEQFKPELLDIIESLEQFYMVTHIDHNGSITYTNKAFLETSKWTPKRVLGKTLWQMFPNTEIGQQEATEIWEHVSNGKPWSGTVEKVSRVGDPYYVKMTAIPIIRSTDELVSVITFELDMTKDVQLHQRLEQIAFFDYETGLMSRHNLETTVNKSIAQKSSFAFVYLAIDHFYAIQDFHSNESRKEIIQSFTNRIKRFFQNSQIARVGVNEFVVLTQYADWFIEGFNDFLDRHPIYIENDPLSVTVSGGIIRYPEDQETYTNMMKAAISATQDVMNQGGGKITTLSTASHKALNRKSLIHKKLISALQDHKLQVAYQPQIDSQTGDVLLYEALVRWYDDELGHISPDELIPIAEEHGLIQKIGEFVLTEAAQLAATLHHANQPTNISVNTSVREFKDPKHNKQIMSILQKASCPPELIQLEITETFAFKAEEENSISSQMKVLKDAGVEFALDDFGTGFASFRYMQSLPITKIKIDKLFINSLTTHEQTKKLVNGMIQFAKSMDMYVVAEGVETEEQLTLLKQLEVDALQGYFIGHPMTKKEITSTLHS
ncbi:EAL domain-containing protein [Sporosarcina pasteurii]|uniref:Oxygen sensor protein DosP n=1 Tax=Sporosarcina pasteurii TaxID=1474 RepID=A0A380BEC2_SPOPA|nr:EAL domain-containing protein [Sporosarcina pasteurii]MDS9472367.1 EAL domain-containing protein [Sporosarcina pasteurii]QBQ06345.1 EAL domain-containing protein [Sporosarcina pasteurii]SUI98920.1 Oxygen sensor protein DosP [Sporosarcina pasteurii]